MMSDYVTETLDDKPIVRKDVVRISHRDQLADLTENARDAEKAVLSRAVCWRSSSISCVRLTCATGTGRA